MDVLVLELFEEGNWRACRTECRRAILAGSEDPAIPLLDAMAGARMGSDTSASLETICANSLTPREIAAMAHFELGCGQWADGKHASAFENFRLAFTLRSSEDIFLRSGCSMSVLLKEDRTLADGHADLAVQLDSCARLWTSAIWKECRGIPVAAKGRRGLAERAGRSVIEFYRAQIGPAIGNRCSLTPSCSEYAKRAFNRHGALAIPITADRLVREPSVVSAEKNPVRENGQWRYRDAMTEHDWWMTGKREVGGGRW